ncbi:formyl transferase family protein (macronuclear) [Tetrahymena thermophila SB210]|uniref:Formyl transferase family protein n=1 Tax=Tetrahymena thermophila (strain SB210) TaxID=312017 RepID=Q24I89_TETTS|nr:formyl transferase family protein [Tetrahymena thermophila SB210]EAS07508.3 formyl transferase family protein [Tetrahymena thermophila SB210]|eukprot:XP_001027750.3 formyl transferase family protein [Tetrahymena thermophila SB210]
MSINKSISLGVLADKQQIIMQQDIFSQNGQKSQNQKQQESFIPITNLDNQQNHGQKFESDEQDEEFRDETEEQNLINQLISILGNEEYKLQIPENLKNEALALLRTKMIINNQNGGENNTIYQNQINQILGKEQSNKKNDEQFSNQNSGAKTNSQNQQQEQQLKIQQLQQQLNNQYGLNQELINSNEEQDNRIQQEYYSEKNKSNQQYSSYQANYQTKTDQNWQPSYQDQRYGPPENSKTDQFQQSQQQPVSFACSPTTNTNILIPNNSNDPKSIINVNDLLNRVNPKQLQKGNQEYNQLNQNHLENITEEPSFSNNNSNTKNAVQKRQTSTSPISKSQKTFNQNTRGRTDNNSSNINSTSSNNNSSNYGYTFNNNSLLNNINKNNYSSTITNQNPNYLNNMSDSGKKRTASSSVKKISRSFYSQNNNNNNNFNSTNGSTILNNSFTYISNSGNSQNYQIKLLNKIFQSEKENNQNEISDMITPQKNSGSLNKRQRTMTHSHSLNKTFAQPSKQLQKNPQELKKLKISSFQNFSQGAIGKLQILENEIKSSQEQKRLLQEQINQLKADIALEKKWQEESTLNNQVLQNQMNNINKNCSMLIYDGVQKKKLLSDSRLEIKEIENDKEQIMNKIEAINQQTKQEKEYIYTYKVLIEEIKKQIKNELKLRNDLKEKVQNNKKMLESLQVKKDALFNKNCTIIQSVEQSLNRYFEKQ